MGKIFITSFIKHIYMVVVVKCVRDMYTVYLSFLYLSLSINIYIYYA